MNSKERIVEFIKAMFFTVIVSTLIYVLLLIIANAIFLKVLDEAKFGITVALAFIDIIVIYPFCLYRFKIKKRCEVYSKNNSFNVITEAKSYILGDGKYMLAIYAVLGILCEINALFLPLLKADFFGTICTTIFPLLTFMNVPVLHTVLSITIVCFTTICLEVYKSYRIDKNKLKGEK